MLYFLVYIIGFFISLYAWWRADLPEYKKAVDEGKGEKFLWEEAAPTVGLSIIWPPIAIMFGARFVFIIAFKYTISLFKKIDTFIDNPKVEINKDVVVDKLVQALNNLKSKE